MTGKATGGGWCSRAWVVAVAGCAVMSCISWTFRCSGVMYVAFLHDFRLTRKQAAWPLALFSIASCLTGPVAGFLAHHVAMRTLCILATLGAAISVALSSISCGILQISIWLGVAQGVCCSFHYTLTSPLVASFFDQHITTAMGVLYMGPAIGSFIMIPLFGWSYKEYGLRGAFLIFSGVTLHAVPFLLLMHDPARRSQRVCAKNCRQDDCSLPECAKYRIPMVDRATYVFRQPMFYVIAVSNVVIGYCNTTVLSVIVDYAIDRGVPEVTAMAILNVANVGDLVGRASFGWITDRRFLSRSQMMFAEYAVLGTLVSTLSGASGSASLIAIVFLYACTIGSVLVLFTNIVKDYLGSEWMPLASGWMMFFGGWTLFTGPPLVGYFRDIVGSYVSMFMFLGLACFSCSALWALVVTHEYWTLLRARRRQQKEIDLETQGRWQVAVKLRVNGTLCTTEDMQSKSLFAA